MNILIHTYLDLVVFHTRRDRLAIHWAQSPIFCCSWSPKMLFGFSAMRPSPWFWFITFITKTSLPPLSIIYASGAPEDFQKVLVLISIYRTLLILSARLSRDFLIELLGLSRTSEYKCCLWTTLTIQLCQGEKYSIPWPYYHFHQQFLCLVRRYYDDVLIQYKVAYSQKVF